ncbi:hypothetical protein NEMIN01_2153 [Nematocida minor]|uniref:uncharacterized protein n=1 Tax=Nematocida minor TaxID=1912983 RepID=UPI00221F91C7|nr:uncharacterized protein NEMIN01_2153 [Nematocida minor]KAI5192686.1 hypothetical protein NEMIN01_2153 [Nematocida minor]
MEPRGPSKKECLIITHDNAFHMDDVIACFMLRKIYPNSTIVRTRDSEIIKTGDIVVDVGGVFDEENRRYDHHQKGFHETYSKSYNVKLSSAGLVYKYHGKEFIKAIGIEFDDSLASELFISTLYNTYFVSVDANDNGIDISDSVKYNQRVLDDMVKSFVPYNLSPVYSFEEAESIRYEAFLEAMEYMGSDLIRHCNKLAYDVSHNGKRLNEEYLALGEKNDYYLVLTQGGVFSKDIIYYYNNLYKKKIHMIISPRKTMKGNTYSIQSIPDQHQSKYKPLIPLCEEWRGLRNEELRRVSGLADIEFVHATGFCGSAETLETAITMAEESIKEYLENKE